MRNSSLVKWSCADNVTGLKPATEAVDIRKVVVGERCLCSEAEAVSSGGLQASEDAGMSSEKRVRIPPPKA